MCIYSYIFYWCFCYTYVEPLYSTIYYKTILHVAWQWQVQDIEKTMNLQKTLPTLSPLVTNGVPFVDILEKSYPSRWWNCNIPGLVTVNLTSPRTAAGKTHVGLVNLLYLLMFKIRKIKPNSGSVRQKPKSFHGDCRTPQYSWTLNPKRAGTELSLFN